jgi:hypothetical protein
MGSKFSSKKYTLAIEAPVNGRLRKSTVTVLDAKGKVQFTDRADLAAAGERDKLVKRLAQKLKKREGWIREQVESAWNKQVDQRHEQQAQEEQAAADAPPPPAAIGGYLVDGGRICRLLNTPNGPVVYALCNFNAQIVEEVLKDDGLECSTVLALEGVSQGGRSLGRAEISAADFHGMNWPVVKWGTRAVVNAGMGAKDHLRAALQYLSGEVPRRVVYTHTGWRQLDGTWHYLHGGGAIPAAAVLTDLADLQHFTFPAPPTGEALREAVRASLHVLHVLHEKEKTYPLVLAAYRVALGGSDFSVHIAGPTGAFKTELAALIQQHWGAGMHARNLPGSWISTANSLEQLAFVAKDAILAIDDFAPGGAAPDVARQYRELDRLLRAQGNRQGRQRMRPDGTLRPPHNPRGLLLVTGEDRPRHASIIARACVVEIEKKDMQVARLKACQDDAAAGLYAQAMAAFIAWVAPQYEAVQAELRRNVERFRDQAYQDEQHRRTATTTGELLAGWKLFLRFAQETGVLNAEEANELWNEAWAALVASAAGQARHHEHADPAKHFLRLLRAVLASGRAHLAAPDGDPPRTDPTAYGWHKVGEGDDEHYVAKGQCIGWVTPHDAYLEPEVSFAEVQKLASDQGVSLPVSPITLHKRLHEQKLLVSVEADRLTVRHTLGGLVRSVLHLSSQVLSPPPENVQIVQNVQETP